MITDTAAYRAALHLRRLGLPARVVRDAPSIATAIEAAIRAGLVAPGDDPLLDEDWPECQCVEGCTEPAVVVDDGDNLVCDGCEEYACDDDGQPVCAHCCADQVEFVAESCGAGGQIRSYARMRPPEQPEQDPDGAWACYWETVGDDAHVVSRHATREDAEQAVRALDWPPPGDHTRYLCGYEVRRLEGDRWVAPDDD